MKEEIVKNIIADSKNKTYNKLVSFFKDKFVIGGIGLDLIDILIDNKLTEELEKYIIHQISISYGREAFYKAWNEFQ